MSSKEPDIYIKILKYVKENGPVEHQHLSNEFKGHEGLVKDCFARNGVLIPAGERRPKEGSKIPLKMLSFEGRFHLLEHEELQDARKSSKQAMIVAIISIILTFFSIVYSLITTQKVIVTNPVTIIEMPENKPTK